MRLALFISSVMMLRGFTRALQLTSPPSQRFLTNFATSSVLQDAIRETVVPKIGIMDVEDGLYTPPESGFPELPFQFKPQTSGELFRSRFGLWRQPPWKKIKAKVIIRAKFGGSLPLESAAESVTSFFAGRDTTSLQTFNEFTSLCILGAYDPRIKAIFLELGPLACGYAKIDEMIRLLNFFRASGKPVVGYATGAGMKEYYLSRAFDEFYLPPEGQLTLQGFASQSTFVRGALEKIGVEPEVRFIGKYKSFGESLIRKNMSDAQRESTSLILNELSDRWAAKVAASLNKTHDEVTKLWTEVDSLSPYDFKDRGFITGVMYKDQVEKKLQDQLTTSKPRSIFNRIVNFFLRNKDSDNSTTPTSQNADYDLQKDFEMQPRRQLKNYTAEELKTMQNETQVAQKKEAKAAKMKSTPNFFPVQTYLSKMKKGFRILQGLPVNFGTNRGPRVAVINAFGGISQGKSGNSPTGGRSVGADSIVELIKRARLDTGVKAVVLRVDSPGGDALASDLVWRELRALSKEKPVVASMVDTAASGGYYFSMACDQIVAEQATLTGSIGVVLAAIKYSELNKKLDVTSEILSIGRYPSILVPDKPFTAEEELYFDAQAKKAYLDFTTKAAASRSMPVDTLQEVAQGRVWFGRQAIKRGLVDHLGGLWTAVDIAYDLAHMKPNATANNTKSFKYNVEIFQDRSPGALAAALGGASSGGISAMNGRVMALASDEVFNMNLVSEESLGGSPVLSQLGLNAQWTMLLKSSPEARPFFQWLEQGEKLGGVRNLWNIVVQKLGL